MSRELRYIEDVVVLNETDKALLVRVKNALRQVWVPKSVIVEDESEVLEKGDEGTLAVHAWFAEREEL